MTTQGMNPETVFADLQPVLYAASVPIDGGYYEMSKISATLAAAYGGIAGRRVLDIGCGYGLTSLATAAFGPQRITAIDSSAAMIWLLELVLLSQANLDRWLRNQDAPEILGEYYAPTLQHFLDMRGTYQGGLFQRRGGEFRTWLGDGLRIADHCDALGGVEVIVGNNYLHWPVNQRIAAFKKEKPDLALDSALVEACRDALEPLAAFLPPGGIAVMMEPNDFVVDDQNPGREADLDANCLAKHPLYVRFHRAFNELLEREYGIERSLPKRSPLFRLSELPELVRRGGFGLRAVHHAEWTYPRVLDSIFVRLPLALGGLKLPFAEKMKLGARVRQEFQAALAAEPALPPWVWFTLGIPLINAGQEGIMRGLSLSRAEPLVHNFWVGLTTTGVTAAVLIAIGGWGTLFRMGQRFWIGSVAIGMIVVSMISFMLLAYKGGGSIALKKLIMQATYLITATFLGWAFYAEPLTAGKFLGMAGYVAAFTLMDRGTWEFVSRQCLGRPLPAR